MKVFHSNSELDFWSANLSKDTLSIGFVPTMGALHLGHLKLIERACLENDYVVCSIYVNPTQFNNSEDLAKYPRDLEKDLKLLSKFPNLAVYHPSDKDIYPTDDFKEPPKIDLKGLEKVMEGANRPGHFEGVTTVVKRLFEIVRPQKAYFGLKDYQQYLIVKRLADSYFPEIEIIANEIIRSEKGLALSSRNERLSNSGLIQAARLNNYLRQVVSMSRNYSIHSALEKIIGEIELDSNISLEYLTIADAETLSDYNQLKSKAGMVFIAAWVENIRLIDNMRL